MVVYYLYLFYPTHEGHEISFWFLGVMTGWYVGSSQIHLATNQVTKLFLSLISLVGVFFAMIFITQIESLIELSGIMSILYSYSLGLFFSIFVTWVIPRFWKLLNLAN